MPMAHTGCQQGWPEAKESSPIDCGGLVTMKLPGPQLSRCRCMKEPIGKANIFRSWNLIATT